MGVMKRDIGLGVKAPDKSCDSRYCPFHGHLKVRGRVFKGRVVSRKSTKTAVVEWDYYHYVPKYERYERRKTRISAHCPECIEANVEDIVKVGECRPLSKTKKFVIIEKVK
jgi:small subunit ribosomal protein S17